MQKGSFESVFSPLTFSNLEVSGVVVENFFRRKIFFSKIFSLHLDFFVELLEAEPEINTSKIQKQSQITDFFAKPK